MLADMLCGAIGCIGFSWAASPACTELETVMLDWLGKMLHLPESFIAGTHGHGGGVIQSSLPAHYGNQSSSCCRRVNECCDSTLPAYYYKRCVTTQRKWKDF
ncbi:hypothetical protein ATANTOWER_025615 [Ataeniobius toweri]|uniref:Aromatic-L-amino-acid decarboxylase n=1 Tax=Ataeniobius toweri TaxID=208326 RepID=A0ABU7BHN7_9TELE|nr:hypothetical protein [Ataeniobius toweri]